MTPSFDSLWDYSDPAGTEAKFGAVLPGVVASGDPDLHAQLLSQIARTLGLRRMFAEADAQLDEAERLLPGTPSVATLRIALERGRVRNSSNKQAEAVPFFHRALELAKSLGAENLAVDAAHMLGIADEPARRMAWHEEALAMAEAAVDPAARNWRGSLLNNMGWTYHDQGNFTRALDLFEKALAFRLEKGSREPILIAQWCIARALRSLGRVEDALAMQQALFEEHRSGNSRDGFVHEELAECLLALGRGEEARPHFGEAHAILSKDEWFVANEGARLKRLGERGRPEVR